MLLSLHCSSEKNNEQIYTLEDIQLIWLTYLICKYTLLYFCTAQGLWLLPSIYYIWPFEFYIQHQNYSNSCQKKFQYAVETRRKERRSPKHTSSKAKCGWDFGTTKHSVEPRSVTFTSSRKDGGHTKSQRSFVRCDQTMWCARYQRRDNNTKSEFVIGTVVIMAAWLTWECSYVTSDQWCYSPLPGSPFTSY